VLSYRHGFHAGGWADVHKHVAVVSLLLHLRQKATPFVVLDVFAGDAVYDLTGLEATKTREFETGISRIYNAVDMPHGVAEYLSAVRDFNGPGHSAAIRHYPGSPALARAALRTDDRLILNELHPTAHRSLLAWARHDSRIAVHKRDATELLGALVTPKLRRGLVLLDPAYEVKSEYQTVPEALARAVTSWPQGIYALWYPVLVEARHCSLLASLHRVLADMDRIEALVTEIAPPAMRREPQRGMRGAGLIIINQPWRFRDDMEAAGDWLATQLWPSGGGRHNVCALADYPHGGYELSD
jgi:23S rRNA (adenine2030-N6)-methyltransferase